jgi:hypothetical protein
VAAGRRAATVTVVVRKIEHLPHESRELLYHSEPFGVACENRQSPIGLDERA